MSQKASGVKVLVQQVAYGALPEWRSACRRFQIRGKSAVSVLITAIEEELARTPLHTEAIQRLAALLSDFSDSRSVPVLVHVAVRVSYPLPLDRVVLALEERLESADCLALVQLLTMLLEGPKPLVATTPFLSPLPVAQLLVQCAERTPRREFRAALPLLHYKITAPLEFIGLQRRLRAALSVDNLPIPAVANQATEDLPIPANQGDDDTHE